MNGGYRLKAAVYKKAETIEIEDIKVPSCDKGEALIRVHYSGICGSDLFIYSGEHPRAEAPLVMGHEFSGEIVELDNSESNLKVGDKVVVRPTFSCGDCYPCREGYNHVCSDLKLIGIDTDGGFAEYVKVPVDQIFKLPGGLDTKRAALVEPLAVAVHSVRTSQLEIGDDVVVLGAGPIGILVGLTAKLAGAGSVYITDFNKFRLNRAQKLGLCPVNIEEKDPVEYITEVTSGRLADITFDAAGVQGTADVITSMTKIKGKIVVVGVFEENPSVDFLAVNFEELNIMGTRVYTDKDFKRALDILEENPEIEEVVTDIKPVEEINQAIEKIIKGDKVLKVLIEV